MDEVQTVGDICLINFLCDSSLDVISLISIFPSLFFSFLSLMNQNLAFVRLVGTVAVDMCGLLNVHRDSHQSLEMCSSLCL
jgi:hypothetical protein